ncbi:flagellar hook protein FlgE, partial [Campylobacter coli]|nr:flagellar hook protein FlgE [Campylobacter coli]
WDTQSIDSSRSPQNIFIDPGMHIPAAKSTEVAIKANLNSGLNIGNAARPLYALDSVHGFNKKTGETKDENDNGITQFYTTSKNSMEVTEKGVDAGSLFNGSGQGLNLREGQGIWMSFADSKFTTNGTNRTGFDANNKTNQNNVVFWGSENQKTRLDITLNGVAIQNADITSLDQAIAYINTFTNPQEGREGTGIVASKNANGTGIIFTNRNENGTTDNMKNINLVVNAQNTAGELWNATWNQGNNNFTFGNGKVNANGSVWTATGGTNNQTTGPTNAVVITAHKYTYSSSPQNIPPMYNPDGGAQFTDNDNNANTKPTDPASGNYWDALKGSLYNTDVRVFRTTEDLRELLQRDARYGVDYNGNGAFATEDINQKVTITVSDDGRFTVSNAKQDSQIPANALQNQAVTTTAKDLSFNVTAYTDALGKVSTNDAFTKIFKAFDGVQTAGSQKKESEQLKLSAFSAGLEIYDSLGSKHTLEVQFVKQSTTQDGGNEWQMIIRVPEPAEINTTGEGPNNIVVGTARFNNDGSLASYNPKTL